MKKIRLLTFLSPVILLWPATALAEQPSASLSLSSGTYLSGSTFQDTIYEDSGTNPINIVDAELSYNPAELEVISIDVSSPDFMGTLKKELSSGKLSIIRYGTKVKGRVAVATISFRSLGPSSSRVEFLSSSKVYSGQNDRLWDGVNNAGRYSFTTPKPAPLPPTSSPPAQSITTAPTNTPAETTPSPVTLGVTEKIPHFKINNAPVLAATPTVALTNSVVPMLWAAGGSLLFLAALGWLYNSKHPIAAKVRTRTKTKLL